jgi:hypothetical protein
MQRKFRIISAITAGSLALAAVGFTIDSGTGRTATQASLTARTESFPPVNLDDCPTLHIGYPQGGCVAQLQTDLNVNAGSHILDVDGVFGSKTYDAVRAFQQAHNLRPDGMAGPETNRALEAAINHTGPTAAPSGPTAAPSGPTAAPTVPTAASPPADTSGSPDAGKYTRTSHSFFGAKACVSGYCIGSGQSILWYDSTDPAGHNLRRIQLNWADPGRPCSTWIDFDAWSTSGNQHYWHIQGDTQAGCLFRDGSYALNNGTDNIPADAQAAVVCGTLFRAGNPQPKLLTRTCVDVG